MVVAAQAGWHKELRLQQVSRNTILKLYEQERLIPYEKLRCVFAVEHVF